MPKAKSTVSCDTSIVKCEIISLSKSLGSSLHGIGMLVFGFFNMFWAFLVYSEPSAFRNIGATTQIVANLFFLADFLCLLGALFFSLWVLTYKFYWAYRHFYNVHRALETKIIID